MIANLSSHTVGSPLLPDVTFPVTSSCNNWNRNTQTVNFAFKLEVFHSKWSFLPAWNRMATDSKNGINVSQQYFYQLDGHRKPV